MHLTIAESTALARAIVEGTAGVSGGDIVVAPVFTALASVAGVLKGSHVALAAQNVFYEEKGAYTGEVAPAMVKDAGCEYAIIGHSERRKYFHETDGTVNAQGQAGAVVPASSPSSAWERQRKNGRRASPSS